MKLDGLYQRPSLKDCYLILRQLFLFLNLLEGSVRQELNDQIDVFLIIKESIERS